MKHKRGQRKALLEHLKNHNTITNMEAFELYGITRLSAKIFDLRQDGYEIKTHIRAGKTRFGTHCEYAEYELIE